MIKKALLFLSLIIFPTIANGADLESRIIRYYTESVEVQSPKLTPFVGLYGSYGFNNNYGGIGINAGVDYENLRFMLSYDYFRKATQSTHMLSTEAAYLFPVTNTFKIGPSIGVGYQYAPAHNNIFGTVGIIASISFSQNWELTNRYRFVYNNGNRQEHIISSGITYRF